MGSPKVFLLVVTFFTLMACWEGRPATGESSHVTRRHGRLDYPPARRDMSVVDNYHGLMVNDPYRWLENATLTETKAFVTAQNAISQPFFDSCPVKDNITAKLRMQMRYERFGCPKKVAGKYYYHHNTGLQNQYVMYVQDTLTSQPSVFLDPNRLSEDGSVSLSWIRSFTSDGALYAYSLSKDGSDWKTIKVKQAPSGEDLNDTLGYVKISGIAWTPDNRGFYYSRYPLKDCGSTGNYTHGLYYHRLGDDQCQDTLVFDSTDQWLFVLAEKSIDDRYVIIKVHRQEFQHKLYIVDLERGFNDIFRMVENTLNGYQYITNVGTKFYWSTDKDAPLGKIFSNDLTDIDQWVTVIQANRQTGTLSKAYCVNDKLVLEFIREAKSEVSIYNLRSGDKEYLVPLTQGSVGCIEGSKTDTEMFIGLSSFQIPRVIYRLDMMSYQMKVYRNSRVKGFHPKNFTVRQVFYRSKDGTRVPMFLVHKKNLTRTGNHPALLYGYGGFGLSPLPYFDVRTALFVNNFEGVYAVANIRGGGEYGEEWHKNGSFGNKQNSFDDFQSAADYLIRYNYTNKNRLAINGVSNGGLLVAACLNQKPALFAAGVAAVGVYDMLRYHLFEFGPLYIPEYGSADIAEQFQWLKSYSPLHNIPSNPAGGQYPATLLLTAENDDRVPPLHSLKFIAELQHTFRSNSRQTNPLLLYVEKNAGHGGETSTAKRIEGMVRVLSFLYKILHLKWVDA